MTRLQIDMDQCSGKIVALLRGASISMEDSYHRLNTARDFTVATCAYPPACPAATEAFSALAKIEKGIQAAVKVFWELNQADRCSLPKSVLKSRFPSFDFPMAYGSEEDLVDPERDRFLKSAHGPELVSFIYQNQKSTAALQKGLNDADWKIKWTE